MEDIEKRNLAVKFCTLSSKDQKSILVQLPAHTRDELLNAINALKDKDFNSPSSLDRSVDQEFIQSSTIGHTNWNNFLAQIEVNLSENGRKFPSRLLQVIKDINK